MDYRSLLILIPLFSCIKLFALTPPTKVWAVGTASGVTLQWTVPTQQTLPTSYTIQRSPTGKNRYTTIGTVHRLNDNEWMPIVLPANKDTLASILSRASNKNIPSYLQQLASERLYTMALLAPEPYLFILGLSYSDTTARSGSSYDYIIVANNEKIAEIKGVAAFKRLPPKSAVAISAKPGDHCIRFSWSIKDNFQKGIRGYNIYRQQEQSTIFKKLTPTPIVTILRDEDAYAYSYFEDYAVENGKKYQYYLTSVDVFGVESEPSEIISSIPANIPPPLTPRITSIVSGRDSVTIDWEKNTSTIVRGFNVYRSIIGSGMKYKLNARPLPPYTTRYVDKPENLPADYVSYSLTTIDNSGIEGRSSFDYITPVPDFSSPDSPDYFQSQTYGNEVRLSWTTSIAKDIKMYELSRSGAKNGEYAVIGNVAYDSVFKDVLSSAQMQYPQWYRIRAVDRRGNVSNWSSPLVATTSYTAIPSPPELVDAVSNGKRITLEWHPSPSKKVSGYYINRFEDTLSTPVTLNAEPLPARETRYIDTRVESDKTYWYELVSIDSMYNFSAPSKRITAYCGSRTTLRAPFIDSLTVQPSDAVSITWRWSVEEAPQGEVIIERSKDGIRYSAIGFPIPSTNGRYIDNSVVKGERYYYRLRYRNQSGITSEPSTPELMPAFIR